ncbi:hypothetical protein HK097_009232 [Rhizophlyctis rosea]|uniref:Uncharacterized protein n=1 Tax=Rhizophlyctis rosea TaxID=64517 RepID=A0AAD5S968_9FUNG|nr:hypothetical protein HK097_009232 [Rhizophlyctis rosea]
MSTQPSLSSCPSLVYREIARHLAPFVTGRFDLKTYLTLQRCCNPTFAQEVRSLMKSPLQIAQAAVANHDLSNLSNLSNQSCVPYILTNPGIRHNPRFLPFLTFKDLCRIYGALEGGHHCSAFSKLFTSKYNQNDFPIELRKGPSRCLVNTDNHIVTARRKLHPHLIRLSFGSYNTGPIHEAFLNVSQVLAAGRLLDRPVQYDFALITSKFGSDLKTLFLGKSNGHFQVIYLKGNDSQSEPYLGQKRIGSCMIVFDDDDW